MKKILTILLFLLTISLVLCGCSLFGDRGSNIIKDLEKKSSYSANLDITFINDKETSCEKGKASFYKGNSQIIKLESGKTITWKENEVTTKVDEIGINHTEIKQQDSLYRYVFPGEYLKRIKTGDGKKYFFKTKEGKEYLVVEVTIVSENKNLHGGLLYIDVDNHLPQEIILLDELGKKRVVVEYKDFKPI